MKVVLWLSTWLAVLQGKRMWSSRLLLNEMSKLLWRNQYQFYFVSYYKWPRWSHQIKNGFVVSPDKHRKCSPIIKLSSRLVLLDIFSGIHFCKLWGLWHSIHSERDVTVAVMSKLSHNLCVSFQYNQCFCSFLFLSSEVRLMEKTKQLMRWEQFRMGISDSYWNSTKCSFIHLAYLIFFSYFLKCEGIFIDFFMDCYPEPANNLWMCYVCLT